MPVKFHNGSWGETLTGVGLALLGVLFASSAAILMRVSHAPKNADRRRVLLAGAVGLLVLDCLVGVLAYGYAPLSLLAPLATLVIVLNALLAYHVLDERLTSRETWATVAITVGSASSVFMGSRQAADRTLSQLAHMLTRGAFVAFIVVFMVMLVSTAMLVRFLRPHTAGMRQRSLQHEGSSRGDPTPEELTRYRLHALAYGVLTSGIASWTNLLAKVIVESVQSNSMKDSPSLFACLVVLAIACACAQLYCLQDMMGLFEAVLIVPIHQCFLVLFLILGGTLMFEELHGFSVVRSFFFCLSVAVSFVGLWVLSQRVPHKGAHTEHAKVAASDSRDAIARADSRRSAADAGEVVLDDDDDLGLDSEHTSLLSQRRTAPASGAV